jgi:Fe-S-cluster-containing hydrogenase component 2
MTAHTIGHRCQILAGRDDSSIVIMCHWEALTSLKEDEAKGSSKQFQLVAAELCDITLDEVLF